MENEAYEAFLELVKSRRTIRAIKPDPLPDELIDKLLEAARWAPTGFNMQPVEFLVVKEPDSAHGHQEDRGRLQERRFLRSGGHPRGVAGFSLGHRYPRACGIVPSRP